MVMLFSTGKFIGPKSDHEITEDVSK
jgi:hypothetical protein